MSHSLDELSDDEVFFGPITLKEVKKAIFLDRYRKTISVVPMNENKYQNADSFNVIEVHSEPERCSTDSIDSLTTIKTANSNFTGKESIASINNDCKALLQQQGNMELHCSLNKCSTELKTCKLANEQNDYSDLSYRKSTSSWDIKSNDDTFLELEKMISETTSDCSEVHSRPEICAIETAMIQLSPSMPKNMIHNKISSSFDDSSIQLEKMIAGMSNLETADEDTFSTVINESKSNENTQSKIDNNYNKSKCNISPQINKYSAKCNSQKNTNLKIDKLHMTSTKTKVTPMKRPNVASQLKQTPLTEKKETFKTPQNRSLAVKLPQSLKKTPYKNAYKHIVSPVVSYIKCPQVQIIKEVYPKKPLAGISCIPKFVKDVTKTNNKENCVLPRVAYKSAKKTIVTTIPIKEKLPKSPWAKKVAASLPKPQIIKHQRREMISAKKASANEDSFADLTLQQAETSYCLKKSELTG